MKYKWKDADELSDAIVDLVNKRLKKTEAIQLLAGQLLALKALERNMLAKPDTLEALYDALNICLTEILELKHERITTKRAAKGHHRTHS